MCVLVGLLAGCATSVTRTSQHSQECKDPASNVLATRDVGRRLFGPKINGFPGLIVDHLRVKFGDPICISFLDTVHKTDRQTEVKAIPHDCRRCGYEGDSIIVS